MALENKTVDPLEENILISQAYSFMRISSAIVSARGAYHKFESLVPTQRMEKILSAFNEALEGDRKIPQNVKDNFFDMVKSYYKEKLEL